MFKAMTLTAVAAAAALSAFSFTPANAQIDVYVSPAPTIVPQVVVPQVVVPYIAESYPNNRGPYGDRDRDGRPNNPYRQ